MRQLGLHLDQAILFLLQLLVQLRPGFWDRYGHLIDARRQGRDLCFQASTLRHNLPGFLLIHKDCSQAGPGADPDQTQHGIGQRIVFTRDQPNIEICCNHKIKPKRHLHSSQVIRKARRAQRRVGPITKQICADAQDQHGHQQQNRQRNDVECVVRINK